MKKAIIISGFMFIAVSTAFGQTQQPTTQKQPVHAPMSAQQRAQMRTDKLSQILQLTEQQKKAVYDINYSEVQKVEVAMKNHDKQQLKQIAQERENSYKTILTPEQYEKYQHLATKAVQTRPPVHQ